MPVWNDKMVAHQAASGQVTVNSAFTWSLLFCNAYQFCSSNVWVLQHHSVHALDMITITVFVYLGLKFIWNQLSSNNSRHTSCIHEGLKSAYLKQLSPYQLYTWGVACWEVTWPNNLQTLGQHWKHTGWCYCPVVFQWQSRAHHLHNWNTPEDHRSHKNTGMPLEQHWLMLAPSGVPVAIFQC